VPVGRIGNPSGVPVGRIGNPSYWEGYSLAGVFPQVTLGRLLLAWPARFFWPNTAR
jgi:hypothetical protein